MKLLVTFEAGSDTPDQFAVEAAIRRLRGVAGVERLYDEALSEADVRRIVDEALRQMPRAASTPPVWDAPAITIYAAPMPYVGPGTTGGGSGT